MPDDHPNLWQPRLTPMSPEERADWEKTRGRGFFVFLLLTLLLLAAPLGLYALLTLMTAGRVDVPGLIGGCAIWLLGGTIASTWIWRRNEGRYALSVKASEKEPAEAEPAGGKS